MSDSSSANPFRRLTELEGRLYKEQDVLTPAEKQELGHEAFRLSLGIVKNEIWQELGSVRRLPQNLSGEALSKSIGLFVNFMERYIESCWKLADLAQPHGIADERCQGAFNTLCSYSFAIIDYGYSLSKLLESRGYSSRPVLRTLDCLLSDNGTLQRDGKLPAPFFSSWPKDKIKLGQIAIQAEVSTTKDNTRTTFVADNTYEAAAARNDAAEGEQAEGASASNEQAETDTADITSSEKSGEREREILVALLALGALTNRRRVSRRQAARKADPHAVASTYNQPIASLAKRGFIHSKKGPNGGIWLTAKGETAAKSLKEKTHQ